MIIDPRFSLASAHGPSFQHKWCCCSTESVSNLEIGSLPCHCCAPLRSILSCHELLLTRLPSSRLEDWMEKEFEFWPLNSEIISNFQQHCSRILHWEQDKQWRVIESFTANRASTLFLPINPCIITLKCITPSFLFSPLLLSWTKNLFSNSMNKFRRKKVWDRKSVV